MPNGPSRNSAQPQVVVYKQTSATDSRNAPNPGDADAGTAYAQATAVVVGDPEREEVASPGGGELVRAEVIWSIQIWNPTDPQISKDDRLVVQGTHVCRALGPSEPILPGTCYVVRAIETT